MKPTISDDCETIDATANYDEEFNMDPKGYLLIRPNRKDNRIEVGWCRQNNVILKLFRGSNAREVCQAVVKSGIIARPEHLTYLGRECLKVEVALKGNIDYVQDADINMNEKIKK